MKATGVITNYAVQMETTGEGKWREAYLLYWDSLASKSKKN